MNQTKTSTVNDRIYPRKPKGKFYSLRTWVSYGLLLFLFAAPFVKINGYPMLMLNIFERKFSIFGLIFYPQDFFIFLLAFIAFFVFIMLFTAIFGRVWCGWACPQTIFMEKVFRKIEYFFEGDFGEQKKLTTMPWNFEKLRKRGLKHVFFIVTAFVLGNVLLGLIIGGDNLLKIVQLHPKENTGLFTGVLFMSGLVYFVYSIVREKICTVLCPYGRMQGVLLDDKSLVVAYDLVRGEPRAKNTRIRDNHAGDCIDCFRCVDVCPTGIDIRNGTQMECVNCLACVDACNEIMAKVDKAPDLIKLASMQEIEEREKPKFGTPRIYSYAAVLFVLLSFVTFFVVTRYDIQVTMLRVPGTVYEVREAGFVDNVFQLKLINKSANERNLTFRVEEPTGESAKILPGGAVRLPASAIWDRIIYVRIEEQAVLSGNNELTVGVYENEKMIQTIKTNFLAP